MKKKFQCGLWSVEYSPDDGARLDRLSFDGYDLLTTEPISFHPPTTDYGEYETRPVYGYDDCFPSVDPCVFPGLDWTIPDHGELCWLAWEASEKPDRLTFTVRSRGLPVLFKRELRFAENRVNWAFEVINEGDNTLPFQHVVHPLMPLDEIIAVEMPAFKSVHDEIGQKTLDLKDPEALRDFLLNQVPGTANMLFLRGIETGKMAWTYRNGSRLEVTFPEEHFPAIGIWWNNSGYPDEDGCRRNECAFEPVPGLNSVLTDAYEVGRCLSVPPGQSFAWQIHWKIER